MDLLSTIRKEGSRGGRADFKWSDVVADQHRENYLGHSLMAPVGRWQKNRNLQWYASADDPTATEQETARKKEIAAIKLAEQEALASALGFPITAPALGGANQRVSEGEVERVVQEVGVEAEDAEERGVGYGVFVPGGAKGNGGGGGEVLQGVDDTGGGLRGGRSEPKEKEKHRHRRERSPNSHRHHRHHRRHRSRSRSRSRSPDSRRRRDDRHARTRDVDHHRRERRRSASPDDRRREARRGGSFDERHTRDRRREREREWERERKRERY
ncbi:MAG: hypothetical protein M1832_003057 [Thelocarpon impressellum]|nr:MAG: hypothetical protein M1832_003057 [Thelocarpon impressellum]